MMDGLAFCGAIETALKFWKELGCLILFPAVMRATTFFGPDEHDPEEDGSQHDDAKPHGLVLQQKQYWP